MNGMGAAQCKSGQLFQMRVSLVSYGMSAVSYQSKR
jgi:hypothetical protein